jgi:hypothetical protein
LKKPLVRTNSTTIILLLLFLFQFRPVSAQNELSDSQVQERLQAIQHMLEQGKSTANLWWYGWLIGYSAATMGQEAVFLTSENKKTRQDMALGAATTFLGAMGQIITPMTPGTAPDRLTAISENTPQERATKLIAAEKLLEESALREKEGRSWQAHAITGIANLGSGLIVWLGFKRSIWEGVGNFALNTVITESQIWTQPTRAIRDYNNNIKKYKSGEKQSYRNSETGWSVSMYPGGIAISFMF